MVVWAGGDVTQPSLMVADKRAMRINTSIGPFWLYFFHDGSSLRYWWRGRDEPRGWARTAGRA